MNSIRREFIGTKWRPVLRSHRVVNSANLARAKITSHHHYSILCRSGLWQKGPSSFVSIAVRYDQVPTQHCRKFSTEMDRTTSGVYGECYRSISKGGCRLSGMSDINKQQLTITHYG
jgi:hypothetical protein